MQYYDPFITGDAYLQALIARQVEEKVAQQVEERVAEIVEERAAEKVRIAEEKARIVEAVATELAKEQIARTEAGVIEALQNTVRSLLQACFPLFAEQKVQEIVLPDKRDALERLIVQISSAPDEKAARANLGVPPAVEIRSKSLEL